MQDDEIGKLAQNIDELALRLEKPHRGENLDNMRNDLYLTYPMS